MHSLTGAGLNVSYQPKHYKSNRSLFSNRSARSDYEYEYLDAKSLENKIVINVGGEIYETLKSTLDKYPETLLGTHEKRALLMDKWRSQIFINRHRVAFEAILFYYQSNGNLARPSGLSMKDFVEECIFYDISDHAIKLMKDRECYLHIKKKNMPPREKYSWFKQSCWTFFDHPREFKNFSGTLYSTMSFMLILTYIGVFCVETELLLAYSGVSLQQYLYNCHMIELSINIYFAMEFLIRIYVYPIPKIFLHKPLNIVELLTVSVYLICYACPDSFVRNMFLYTSRMIRVVRLARVARLSHSIDVATSVFLSSMNDVSAVVFVTLILCIFSGSIMYYVEMDNVGTKFTSIPESMWWAMQSLLCLGYGDIVPETMFGKGIASVVVFFGVVNVTVLLLSLGGRLFDMYSKEQHETCFLPDENEKIDYEIHYRDSISEQRTK